MSETRVIAGTNSGRSIMCNDYTQKRRKQKLILLFWIILYVI